MSEWMRGHWKPLPEWLLLSRNASDGRTHDFGMLWTKHDHRPSSLSPIAPLQWRAVIFLVAKTSPVPQKECCTQNLVLSLGVLKAMRFQVPRCKVVSPLKSRGNISLPCPSFSLLVSGCPHRIMVRSLAPFLNEDHWAPKRTISEIVYQAPLQNP